MHLAVGAVDECLSSSVSSAMCTSPLWKDVETTCHGGCIATQASGPGDQAWLPSRALGWGWQPHECCVCPKHSRMAQPTDCSLSMLSGTLTCSCILFSSFTSSPPLERVLLDDPVLELVRLAALKTQTNSGAEAAAALRCLAGPAGGSTEPELLLGLLPLLPLHLPRLAWYCAASFLPPPVSGSLLCVSDFLAEGFL